MDDIIFHFYAWIFKCNLSTSMKTQQNNPLHGLTLENILVQLHSHYGWEQLADLIRINCFFENPSVSSSLKFLRKTPWARTKVEQLYLKMLNDLDSQSVWRFWIKHLLSIFKKSQWPKCLWDFFWIKMRICIGGIT